MTTHSEVIPSALADDLCEAIRREETIETNAMTEIPKPNWTTEQLRAEFEVIGFASPYVIVKRKSDGARGSLKFRHSPRVYFGWEPTS